MHKPISAALETTRQQWNRLSLAMRFAIAAAAVVAGAMLVIGIWVTRVIETGLKDNAAITTALYVDSVIAPILPELRGGKPLDAGVMRALDETVSAGPLGERLESFRIWSSNGSILYALDRSLIGRSFPVTRGLSQALEGKVVAELNELADEESAKERAIGIPLLEIYSPIREPWSGEVMAVSEFYENAAEITGRISSARTESWFVVAGVTAAMLGLLSAIVLQGSRTIDRQRTALTQRVADLSALSAQNSALRRRVQSAARRAAAINERYLRRLGADLHDGPAQLVAYASLRLGSEKVSSWFAEDAERAGEIAAIRSRLEEAIGEIRSISNGLVLPHLETTDLAGLLELAVSEHERRTGSVVHRNWAPMPRQLSVSEKIVVFRFIQEALNNAFRHAGGKGQAVEAGTKNGRLFVMVSDEGPGFDTRSIRAEGLGLLGMKERVESIGGVFELDTSPAGTRVSIQLGAEELEAA